MLNASGLLKCFWSVAGLLQALLVNTAYLSAEPCLFGKAWFRKKCLFRFAYPTLPSSVSARSFWASTANSIGSWFSTSLQYPFTISATASSVEIPLWLQ